MIKYLISLIFLLFLLSCNELNINNVSEVVNNSKNKIEEIIENKKEDEKEKYQSNTKQTKDNIYYYLGETYFIEGVRYTPEENYSYSEIGISTFYGKELHNVKTINNDYNKVTELLGRHKTLPLPSMVKITNLENGLSINLKIVDRHNDNTALIQVSRKVAQLLGFYKDKIATVRVDILSDSSKQWKNVSMSLNEPEFDKTISSAPTDIVSITNIDDADLKYENDSNLLDPIEILSEEINDYSLFLKISNFKNYEDIQSIVKNISSDIKYETKKNTSNFELILGPLDKNEINNLVSYFISKGYKETKIILN